MSPSFADEVSQLGIHPSSTAPEPIVDHSTFDSSPINHGPTIPHGFPTLIPLVTTATSQHPMRTHTKLYILKPIHLLKLFTKYQLESKIPHSYSQEIKDPNWLTAISEEYNALIANGTWKKLPHPVNVNIANFIWFFKKKHNVGDTLAPYKGRLVANGKSQQSCIDCDETFSPIVKPTNIHTF